MAKTFKLVTTTAKKYLSDAGNFCEVFDRESNLARSYKFENCWGCDFVKVPINYEQFNHFMNSLNIGIFHKISE